MRPDIVACFALLLSSGCGLLKKGPGDAGTDAAEAAASASASEGPAEAPAPPTLTATHAAARPTGPPAAGNPCTSKEGVNGLACAHGGFEELECVAGAWAVSGVCGG